MTACTAVGTDPPQLQRYQPGSGGALQIGETLPERHYAFDDITMCVEGEGSVTILAAAAIEPTGRMSVAAFSVLPAREGETSAYVSDVSESLVDAGYPTSGEMIVSTSCAPDGEASSYRNYTRLGIEVSRTDPNVGTTRGIRVTYESSGEERTIDYPLALALCAGSVVDRPECTVTPIPME
jgi:hypothetical protein